MLQRMQSVWLLLAAICAVLTIKFSFYSGNIEIPGQPASFQYLTATFSIWILIVTIAITCIAAIDIFLYKNRKLQGRLAILGILLSFLNIFLYLKKSTGSLKTREATPSHLYLYLSFPFSFFLPGGAFTGTRNW